ncbi:hypothetical protein [Pseudolactococcus insecticola]|uniref:Uncharacterized protein n=1 Tax=Pseudolactococcus insecticola TaxID=2709158 RepID=A0A6A0B7U7_9LACT|nr:hypothetical protein [Lactococcus insecticola]GFH39857.1 hypothetical protein Hs20B_02550 [Lactococcus insecticola]
MNNLTKYEGAKRTTNGKTVRIDHETIKPQWFEESEKEIIIFEKVLEHDNYKAYFALDWLDKHVTIKSVAQEDEKAPAADVSVDDTQLATFASETPESDSDESDVVEKQDLSKLSYQELRKLAKSKGLTFEKAPKTDELLKALEGA